MDTLQLLQTNLHLSHQFFLGTVADLTQEMLDWNPHGLAHPIGERYAHAVAAEDWMVNQVGRGGTPLFASTWAGKTGFGEMDLGMSAEQAQQFHVALKPLAEYTHAVFDASEEFFKSLTSQDMDRTVDMTAMSYGMMQFPLWASIFIMGHLDSLMGEISALKGMQGLKGYPF
jgi:hypothetical protein